MGKEKKEKLIKQKFELDAPTYQFNNEKKEDYLVVPPITGTDKFNASGEIKFQTNDRDHYLYLPDSFLRCEFEITKEDETALGNNNITLENNWFPKLFDYIIFRIGNVEIDNIQNPGHCDTMLKLIMKSKDYDNDGWLIDRGDGKTVTDIANVGGAFNQAEVNRIVTKVNNLDKQNTGYEKRFNIYNKEKKFVLEFHLRPLLSYLDYSKISYNLTFELILRRKLDDKTIFFGDAGTNAKLKIKNLQWYIPQITPTLEIETMIVKRLSQNKPIDVTFMKRTVHNVIIDQMKYTWNLSTTHSSPRYVFLVFRKPEDGNYQNNNCLYLMKDGDKKIRRLRVNLNQNYYPLNSLNFDLDNNDCSDAFEAFKDLCRKYGINNQIDFQEYKTLYPIFCFDLTAQNEKIEGGSSNLSIEIEKDDDFKLDAYALVLEDCEYKIETKDGRMSHLV